MNRAKSKQKKTSREITRRRGTTRAETKLDDVRETMRPAPSLLPSAYTVWRASCSNEVRQVGAAADASVLRK